MKPTVSALTLFLLNSTSVSADVTCVNGFVPATIDATLTVSSNPTSCPLLDNQDHLKKINKYFPGTEFAYPAIPGTCVSGTGLIGTIQIGNNSAYDINGFTESARRFSDNLIYGSNIGLFSTGLVTNVAPTPQSFLAGGAVTLVHVERTNGGNFSADLFLDDQFTAYFPGGGAVPLDREGFAIMGAGGTLQDARGRLQGEGDLDPIQLPALSIPDFHVTGEFCVKIR